MTALDRLDRTRRRLAATGAIAPIMVAIGTGLVYYWLARMAAIVFTPVAGALRVGAILFLVAALVVGTRRARRAWKRTTTGEAALWIERREPALEYALVTLADPRVELAPPMRDRLLAHAGAIRWEAEASRAMRAALRRPALQLIVGVTLLVAMPAAVEHATRARAERAGTAGDATRAGVEAGAATLAFRVRVVPPAYSGAAARDAGEATIVAALVGSRIEIAGEGARPAAMLGAQAVGTSAARNGWQATVTMPAQASALRLTRGAVARIVVLEPRADSTPVLTLRLPVRDTVLRVAEGRVPLAADARDDIGMSEGRLEYIVSSGEGETFKFRSGTLDARRLGGARSATLAATLDLAGLALVPGDIVHLRAVARDANPRGMLAASETRTLRVMRRGEADSVAIEAAPPPEADKSLLSQRMLIQLTEKLVARQPKLARAAMVDESRRIATDQKRLRRAVGDVVFSRLGEGSAEHSHAPGEEHVEGDEGKAAGARTPEQVLAEADRATGRGADAALDFEGDETPVVAINRPLLEAYNAMWDAALSLDVGEPRAALPPMRRALEAIQRARAAERVYLRGRPPAIVVDLARVRLAGKEKGEPSTRTPRAALPDARARIAARLGEAVVLAARDPAAAADSLLLLRVEALAGDAGLARALGDAAEALRRGGDATAALVRARRVAAGGAGVRETPVAWRGAWSPEGSP